MLTGLFYLTKFFRHKYCLRITRVFTINIQGTHDRAMTTKSDCKTIYTFRGENQDKTENRERQLVHSVSCQDKEIMCKIQNVYLTCPLYRGLTVLSL